MAKEEMSDSPHVTDGEDNSSRSVPAQNETSGRSSGAASPNETKNDNLNVVVNSYQSHSAPVSPRRANRSDHGNSPVPHLIDGTADIGGAAVDMALKKQLSYYFSEFNLAKDSYLLSQMTPEYFVPCALIANFPAVKKLTNDVSHVVATLRICENVQVTLDGTMVRPLFVPFVPMVPTPGPSMHGAGPAVVPGTRSSVPGGARYDGAGPRGGGGRSGGAVYVIVSEGIPKDTPADDVMSLFTKEDNHAKSPSSDVAVGDGNTDGGADTPGDGSSAAATTTIACVPPQWAKPMGTDGWKLKFASESQAQDAQRKLCCARFNGNAIKAQLMPLTQAQHPRGNGGPFDSRFVPPPQPYFGGMQYPPGYGMYMPNGAPVSGPSMYGFQPYMFNVYGGATVAGGQQQQQQRQHQQLQSHPNQHRGAPPGRQQPQSNGADRQGGGGSQRRHKNSTGGGGDAATPAQPHHAHQRGGGGHHRRTSSDGSDLSTGSGGGRKGRNQRPGDHGGGAGGKTKKGTKHNEGGGGGGGGGKKNKKKQSAPILAPENFPALPGAVGGGDSGRRGGNRKTEGTGNKGGDSTLKTWSVPLVDVVKGLTTPASSGGGNTAAKQDNMTGERPTADVSGKAVTSETTTSVPPASRPAATTVSGGNTKAEHKVQKNSIEAGGAGKATGSGASGGSVATPTDGRSDASDTTPTAVPPARGSQTSTQRKGPTVDTDGASGKDKRTTMNTNGTSDAKDKHSAMNGSSNRDNAVAATTGGARGDVGNGGGAPWGQPSGGGGGKPSFADMLKRQRAEEQQKQQQQQ